MKIAVAITGASGAVYARQFIAQLLVCRQVEGIFVVLSGNADAVAEHELGAKWSFDDKRITLFERDDFFNRLASGSAGADAMVIIPCSMGTLGRIAAGVSDDLITRAADVMLKERRRLVLVPRESPYSLVHLNNMVALTQAGAIILPASPGFYHRPTTIEELIKSVTQRIMQLLGIQDEDRYKWKN
ncbi:3-polyprenyl-4-hydroxybenzoate carboxy-lyase UbiX [Mucinivorans hirudinis]|uniref:Flavin prenyltransferase UbiX n=1 Tax=Mucinivorans hirudinis TaxID=1433126 RepID=A0A060RDP6_9BACT|nr:3-polyprenyl-4-hydroxybenzoate carboxy-lyase UbiX [Mucinivorans hirudinis]